MAMLLRKYLYLLMSCSLAICLMAPYTSAETTNPLDVKSLVKWKFPDVKTTHWAYRHIVKLATESIIIGNDTGLYMPEKSVSQQDAIIIAIRMMGLQPEVDAIQSKKLLPKEFIVSEYAHNYMTIALDRGLILLQEEKELAVSAKQNWGIRGATREWLVKIMIRAIQKQNLANGLSDKIPSFTDAKSMNPNSWGYVNAAQSLGLVTGFTDGSLAPLQEVTRAQIATLMSRAQVHADQLPSRVSKGIVRAITSKSITLEMNNGVVSSWLIHPEAHLYGLKSDVKIGLKDIQVLVEVTIVQFEGIIYYIEITNPHTSLEVFEGYLQALRLDNLQVDVLHKGKLTTSILSPAVGITDVKGRGLSFNSLNRGAYLVLKRNKLSSDLKITEIIVMQPPTNKSFKGIVQGMNVVQREIKILEETSNLSVDFPISNKVMSTYADAKIAEISSIEVGDQLSMEVVDSEIVKIIVLQKVKKVNYVEGVLISSNLKSLIITVEVEPGKLSSYYLDSSYKVTFLDILELRLADIKYSDRVRLEIVEQKVKRIVVIK
jgi:hypothetical protein